MRPRAQHRSRRTGFRGLLGTSLLLAAVAALAAACSGGATPPATTGGTPGAPEAGGTTTSAPAKPALPGTYDLVGDIGGTQVKPGARVTLELRPDGTLEIVAVQQGERLTDNGAWSEADGKITLTSKGLGLDAQRAAYVYDGTTLDLPVLMFGSGAGSSRWQRTSPSVAASPGASTTPAPDSTDDSTTVFEDLPAGNWQAWDTSKYATAAAAKSYVEAVNTRHLSLRDAVTAAADVARRASDVAEVVPSRNGLNLLIRYRNGREDELLTERMSLQLEQPASRQITPPSEHRIVDSQPSRLAPTLESWAGRSCDVLPTDPRGITKVNGANLAEPGREGVRPSGGVFGVAAYVATDPAKPLTSDDSPPADARRALVVSPLYRVAHPGPGYDRQGNPKVVLWDGFLNATDGNLECVTADLQAAGYKVDSVLGSRNRKTGVGSHTGVDALIETTKLLATNKYGVVYFLTHGAESVVRGADGDQPIIKLQMGALSETDRKQLAASSNRDLSDVLALETAIRDRVIREVGLPNTDEMRRSINARFDSGLGFIDLWVTSDYFRLVREAKGLDFSRTFVVANACSSAANAGLRNAFSARAFLGWDQPPDSLFLSSATKVIFDELKDHTRSLRQAWQMWTRHEGYVEALARSVGAPERDARNRVERLKLYGTDGVEYSKLQDQSVVLIFRMRHGPPEAARRLDASTKVVGNCWTTFWASGKNVSGLASPACNSIELGNHVPTQEEVDDALFEVSGAPPQPFGRFTLAD